MDIHNWIYGYPQIQLRISTIHLWRSTIHNYLWISIILFMNIPTYIMEIHKAGQLRISTIGFMDFHICNCGYPQFIFGYPQFIFGDPQFICGSPQPFMDIHNCSYGYPQLQNQLGCQDQDVLPLLCHGDYLQLGLQEGTLREQCASRHGTLVA